MTKEQIQQIRKRCDKASHAPWDWHTNRHPNCDGTPWGWVSGVACVNLTWKGHKGRDNAIFITHARTDIPALLDEVERLQAENAILKADIDRANDESTLRKALEMVHTEFEEYFGSPILTVEKYIQKAKEESENG